MSGALLSPINNGRVSIIDDILKALPRLPSVLRYLDDFNDTTQSLNSFDKNDSFVLQINGTNCKLDFSRYPVDFRVLFKHVLFYMITNDYSASTAYTYLYSLIGIDRKLLTEIFLAGPNDIKLPWKRLISGYPEKLGAFPAVKLVLVFFAQNRLAGWAPDYMDFIKITLPYPSVDPYSGIRSGEVFLSAHEEALLVSYINEVAIHQDNQYKHIHTKDIETTCMLICSYLFGMRPIQIALLTMRDIRIWKEDETSNLAVHLTFKMVKQRSRSSAFPLTRRIKHEWSPLFVELYKRAESNGRFGGNRLFDVNSSNAVGNAIKDLATSIVKSDVSATDLRHTAAQRLVDAGASQEEVAEFMGHADLKTCLVYYATSPNQAERVNKALGISPIYQQVVKIAHDKFISTEELTQLKGDQQIAGVPHGIPIAGIGGCSTGQPRCPYNPITSCYGCQKFMPVTDIGIHQNVLDDLRSVVKFFEKSSRGDGNSPAFMQLKHTISHIQSVINELESTNA